MRKGIVATLLVLLLVGLDQWLKLWVKTHMILGESFPFFEGQNWFYIHFIENNGMAFGFELSESIWGKLFLSLFRLVAIFGFIYWIYKLAKDKNQSLGLVICVSLLLAGALGNLIDSLFYGLIFDDSYGKVATLFPESGGYAPFLRGKVVDMFYFPLFEGHFPDFIPFVGGQEFSFFNAIFNIADACISVGAVLLLIFQKQFFKETA